MTFMKTFFAFLVLAFALQSCSTTNVMHDYDETVNFEKYKTYHLFDIDESVLSDEDKEIVVSQLNDTLQAYGLKEKLIPNFEIIVIPEFYQVIKNSPSVNVGFGSYGGSFGGGVGGSFPVGASTKDKFSLTIEFVDALTKSLFWQAVVEIPASKLFNKPEENPDIYAQMISDAIKKYPGFYPALLEE